MIFSLCSNNEIILIKKTINPVVSWLPFGARDGLLALTLLETPLFSFSC